MGDGHLNKCKNCTKKDVSKRVKKLSKNPKWVAQERERCRIKQEKCRKDGKDHPTTQTSRNRWNDNNPIKRKASSIANRAIRSGLIERKKSCEECGAKNVRLEKHHEDYSKPLEFLFLCCKCHGKTKRK